MGRGGESSRGHREDSRSKRKSKGRMSYLKRHRAGQGNQASNPVREDESGLKYGGYEPAYSSKPKSSSWRSHGGGGGRRSRYYLKSGMKGFLCTTNMKKRECVVEAYNILNEYDEDKTQPETHMETEGDAEKGPSDSLKTSLTTDDKDKSDAKVSEIESSAEKKGDDDGSTDLVSVEVAPEVSLKGEDKEKATKCEVDDEDIDAALAKELKEFKSERTAKKFQSVDTGVNNVIFISTTIADPTELAYRIFDDVTAKKETKSRFLLRLLPIDMTCNANDMDEVKARSKEILEKHLKTGYNSFRVVVNVRFNGKFGKDQLIKIMADLVSQVNPLNVVDLKNAQYTVVVEILKSTLCLGVVKDFTKFRKYNLLEAGMPAPPPVSEETPKVETVEQDKQVEVAAMDVTPKVKTVEQGNNEVEAATILMDITDAALKVETVERDNEVEAATILMDLANAAEDQRIKETTTQTTDA